MDKLKILQFYQLNFISSKMSDFKYDSYDQSAMKVAFEHLRQTQQRGFWYGALVGLPAGALYIHNVKKVSKLPVPWALATTIPLLAGSVIYGLYSWSARNAYAETASKINRKYAKIINKIINY